MALETRRQDLERRWPEAEQQVLDHVRTRSEIRNAQARKLTGITCETRMKEVFYRLREQGMIERVEGLKGNKSVWQLAKPRPAGSE